MTRYAVKSKPSSLTSDSREVTDGAMFLAYPGEQVDGRTYIEDAIKRGASSVFWEAEGFEWQQDWAVENKAIPELRYQVGQIADQFYGRPSSKLHVVGVTGTNGKTSITQWLAQCFGYVHNKAAVIGTLGNGFPGRLSETNNTTPDALLLHRLLSEFAQEEAETVAIEVSSHGLKQGRVNGVHFDIAVLTNLSRDHLDYHDSFEEYANVKKSLFTNKKLKTAVLNIDDDFGVDVKETLDALGISTMTYGIDAGDVRASNIVLAMGQIKFHVDTPSGEAEVRASLIGRFNVYNLLAVLSTLLASGVALFEAVKAISKIEAIEGRMQKLGGGKAPMVVVDYAHTPDSLKHVLEALKEETERRLICVIGCGGNRDQGKRVMMGEVASQLADAVIVTSDNPRDENPLDIIQEILAGVEGDFAVEESRATAISVAIASAYAGDVVLIAGKGHETYQEVAGERYYFSDVEHVQKALSRYEVTIS